MEDATQHPCQSSSVWAHLANASHESQPVVPDQFQACWPKSTSPDESDNTMTNDPKLGENVRVLLLTKVGFLPVQNGTQIWKRRASLQIKLSKRFFFRPTPDGSRQVVYQAGKAIAFCKFTELMQWQHQSWRQCAYKRELNWIDT